MRLRVRLEGTVQGVGFRPFVYRLAREEELTGWVLNDAGGVLLEVEGTPRALERFQMRVVADAPPLAVIDTMHQQPVPVQTNAGNGYGDESRRAESGQPALFEIRSSIRGDEGRTRGHAPAEAAVAPDTATCSDCLAELLDPTNRRYRYPFINCTNCGPRFTIVRETPYDRRSTTMSGFQMCASCLAEYENPADRRFHAQPNACRDCGPTVSLVRPDGLPAERGTGLVDHVRAAALALRAGSIVAIKGIGGFHLACRADDETAVGALRSRKNREDKPFALMVANVKDANALIALGDLERALLTGPQRPIVLAPRLKEAGMAESVAPGSRELGVMLAYSPLHHLLLADAGVTLVMTSGNVSDEPIACDDKDALARLDGVADLLLVHNRPIETRTDDSVVRTVALPSGQRQMFLRRSRGYVPNSLSLPDPATRQILACGGELKNTFCVTKGSRAWISHHIGDLKNYETLRSFAYGIEHFKRLFSIEPTVVAHDLHPEYLSTKYAMELELSAEAVGHPDIELIGVQHHHAHFAACLAEHGETGPAVGAIYDGTGYGSDGTVWGGELLIGDLSGFRRSGALAPVRMPGGERAISEPWRMACAWLATLDSNTQAVTIPPALRDVVDQRHWQLVAEIARSGLSSPVTTSMGRLFDAVAALCGVRTAVNYEGQAAIELEAACDPAERGSYEIELSRQGDALVMDPSEALTALIHDLGAGESAGVVAARFHSGIASVTVEACAALAGSAGTEVAVLAGGVFQNRRLLEHIAAGLHAVGLRVLIPDRLPPGDGAISYGQAAVAARRQATV